MTRERECPHGHTLLESYRLLVDSPVEVDSCPMCYGVFLDDGELEEVSEYVRDVFDGRLTDVAAGKQLFATNCVACHGAEGKGMPMMGAPDLTHPAGWIYGSSLVQLQQTLRYGRNGQMPAQEQYLGNDKVHLLAAYVYSLSQQPVEVAGQ